MSSCGFPALRSRRSHLVFFEALFVVVDGLSDTGLPDVIYQHLRPVFGSTDNADLEPRMVLRGRFESFLERSVCSRRREMDRALYRSRADVESNRADYHFCRQPHNRRFGGKHDRNGICARTSGSWLLGLRALRHSNYDSHDDRRGYCPTRAEVKDT